MMNFHKAPLVFPHLVALKVTDIERSLRFYQEVLGLKILEQSKNKACLTADGKTALISIEQPEKVTPKYKRTTGLYHFALLLPKRSDLADVLQHFIRYGIRLGASDHLVSEALYLSDPDGNGIEIYADRPDHTWAWANGEIMMTTEPLDLEGLLTETSGNAWQGLPAGTIMGHIHLHVASLETAEEFYTKGLGFNIVLRYGGQATFMSTGGYHHHIAINTWAGVGAPPAEEHSAGMKYYSLVYPSIQAREDAVRRLQGLGAPVVEQDGSVYTEDPSGNRVYLLENYPL